MNVARSSILESLQGLKLYLPTQQKMLRLKCMAYVLYANWFMDTLMQVPCAATGVKIFTVLQKLFSILIALRISAASCT